MSEQPNSSAASASAEAPADLDNENLWGWWREQKKWQSDLHRKAAYKSLNIPEDDPTINAQRTTNVTNSGLGKLGTAAVIGASMLGGAGAVPIAYYALERLTDRPAAVAPVEPTAAAPPVYPDAPDTEYDVLFYDKDGNPIAVPHISTRPKD